MSNGSLKWNKYGVIRVRDCYIGSGRYKNPYLYFTIFTINLYFTIFTINLYLIINLYFTTFIINL